MIVCGIDPGPSESAAVLWDGERAISPVYMPNRLLEGHLSNVDFDALAIERVNYYSGANVGMDVFETAFWSGRFAAQAGLTDEVLRQSRPEISRALIGDPRAKKSQVNAYLRDTFGPVGTKKKPGPLYGVSGHVWDALAVAVVAHRSINGAKP